MYQILLIPNITWKGSVDDDSYVKVISDIIRELGDIRDDLYWHSPIREKSTLLDFPNVSQYIVPMPTYPNSMRGHFDYEVWKRIANWKNRDFDLVYSHLPEWTLNISNLLINATNMGKVPIVGYTHWTEIAEVTNYDQTYIMNNISGLLQMRKCGVNTQAQKDLILNNVKGLYSKQVMRKLDTILEPQYLGIPNDAPVERINENPEPIIAFNHRPHTYKDFPHFIEMMDKLYKERQDFTVWVPLLDKSIRPYMDVTKYAGDKEGYYKHLQRCNVCYCPKQKYAGWSVSGTDAMMNGVPVIHYDDSYYDELFKIYGDKHTTDDHALKLFNIVLSEIPIRNIQANKALSFVKRDLVWSKQIVPIHNMINEALDSTKPASDKSVKKDEILDFIKKKKKVSKRDIMKLTKWGVGIKFASYRKYLLTHPDISTIVEGNDEYYISNEYERVSEVFEDFF